MASITVGEKYLCWLRACGIVMLITKVIITFIVQARTCLRDNGGAISFDNRHKLGNARQTEV